MKNVGVHACDCNSFRFTVANMRNEHINFIIGGIPHCVARFKAAQLHYVFSSALGGDWVESEDVLAVMDGDVDVTTMAVKLMSEFGLIKRKRGKFKLA